MLKNKIAKQIVEAVRSRLIVLEQTPGAPRGDAEWLRIRCDDTLVGGDDYWCNMSLRELKKDVANFNAESPGLLDPDLLQALENVAVRL